MKYFFIVLALCLSAVVADDLHGRGIDFHTLHYSQHHQTVEEAKRKIGDVYDGQLADFDEVESYGGQGGVGFGTVGISSGLSGSQYGSSAGSNAEYSASAASSRAANFASSSSFGSNANYASGAYGSGTHGGSSVLIPVVGGGASHSQYEGSTAENVQRVVPDLHISGSGGFHESFSHGGSQLSNAANTAAYHREHSAQGHTSVPVIQFAPSSSGSESYGYHGEHRAQNQASGSAEKYAHIQSEHVQQASAQPLQILTSSPSSGQESYMKYHKVTTTATQPQVFVHTVPSSSSSYYHKVASGSTLGSQSDHLVTGGLSGHSSKYTGDYYGHLPYNAPSTSLGSGSISSASSNSLLTGFGASNQASSHFGASSTTGAGQQSGFGHVDGSFFNSKYGANSNHGTAFGTDSKFGSKFGAESALASGSSLGGSFSSSDLHNYMSEAEILAKMQAQGLVTGGTRVGGSQLNANLESNNAAGFGHFGSAASGGAGNSGYKTKSWEKASKWSSQSGFGPDGQVNNYKEISTGESENYDINGHRTGYKAATATLEDNGKVSSYSLHT